MIRTPILLSLVVTVLAIAGALTLFRGRALQLSHSEMLQGFFGVLAAWGAFVSAIFVIYGYLQTNLPFVESQRPQLLVQVESQFSQGRESSPRIPITVIHYRNITTNMFRDLTIRVRVLAEGRELDLSDLFKPEMVMVGTDQRQRRFETTNLLNERGLDLNAAANSGDAPRLVFSYSYTYNKQMDIVQLHEYKWNRAFQMWEIV